MFGNKKTSDFQIYCGKDKILIPCHKSILEARSKYFMINRRENKFNSIYFNNFSSEIVKPIIKFFYNGKFKFDKQKFDKYFKFANQIKLKEIQFKIELEIQSIFNIENILEIYFKSQKINSKNLSQNCEKFIFQNIQFIISNPNFDKYLNQNQNQIYNFIGLISLNQNLPNQFQIIQQIEQKLNQNNQKKLIKLIKFETNQNENENNEIENSFSNLLNQILQTKSINQFQIQKSKINQFLNFKIKLFY
ncbi:kelch-like protein [Anaeramoeba ignava]|uniref:Kelch-like protein n=1 Tax=Anaeramoeba ignava TaxID=1746090 RepID=A0A9Q0LDT1_ANAIG|nr:kelch-like protein [Anaeramoeba ignava]